MSKINKTEFLSFSEIPNPTMIRIENRELKEIIVELEKKLQEEIKENHKMVIEILELKQENKQQLEELKEKNASLQKEIKLMKSININDNYISKDKIREHLKKFEEIEKEFIFIDNKSTAREINKALIEFSKRLLEE